MAVPDLTNLSMDELREWISALNAQFATLQQQHLQEDEQRRTAIEGAITTLTALLGPATGEAGTTNIRAVRRYDDATLGANAGLALNLAFNGLEQLTVTVLNMANVIASQTK